MWYGHHIIERAVKSEVFDGKHSVSIYQSLRVIVSLLYVGSTSDHQQNLWLSAENTKREVRNKLFSKSKSQLQISWINFKQIILYIIVQFF